MKYLAIIAFFIVGLITVGYFAGNNESDTPSNKPIENVAVVDGVQIVEIKAKGGYQPRNSVAKAGVKTILRINTKGTFDCSSAIRIPSLNVDQILPPSGTTDIELGIQNPGILRGSCGMGMYPFSITFN